MSSGVDPLVRALVRMSDGYIAKVLDIEHEYDDGTALCIVTGPNAVRRWERLTAFDDEGAR